jgi:hypothetical protein
VLKSVLRVDTGINGDVFRKTPIDLFSLAIVLSNCGLKASSLSIAMPM